MFIMYTLVKHKWAQNLETITMHYGPFGIQKFSNLRFLYWEDIGAEFLCYFCPTLHCLKIFYYLYECSKIKRNFDLFYQNCPECAHCDK